MILGAFISKLRNEKLALTQKMSVAVSFQTMFADGRIFVLRRALV